MYSSLMDLTKQIILVFTVALHQMVKKKYVFNGRKQRTHLILFMKLFIIAVLGLSNEYIF